MYRVEKLIKQLANFNAKSITGVLDTDEQRERQNTVDYLVYMKVISVDERGDIHFRGKNSEQNQAVYDIIVLVEV